ncbi:hypothetical protein BN77_p11563 [Rhizobium mesoamericanum STM3625]|uniref:Uncharacterized protein n=1 Tax=Rhizobium mesoamericanum STM3625 TaxID=1211777 RepID=K0PY60_9HYPH|nr:hypothetical protein BN77_p11563 [Rhizobium mesoamericanum STM3625]
MSSREAVGSSRFHATPSLAEKAGIAFSTVHRFETTGSATEATKEKIKAAPMPLTVLKLPMAITQEPVCV